MATGSRRYFEYESDEGDTYGMELDESTYETAELGFGQQVDLEAPTYSGLLASSATRPLAPRYLNLVGTDADGRTVRRRVFVGDPDADAWTDPQSFSITLLTVSGGVATPTPFVVSSAIGEQRRYIPRTDTGLTDGDEEVQIVEAMA